MSGGVTFRKVGIESAGDIATVEEVRANQDKVMSLLEEWTIALVKGGKIDGPGHGGKVQEGDYKGQCGEKIIILGRAPKELKFKKVPADSAGDMATVAEARANHEKVLSLLDEWTIALLDGGKVDGKGHGGKVQDGDFKGQCGEKIIVEGSEIKEIEANITSHAQSMTQATPGYPDCTQYYQNDTGRGVRNLEEPNYMAVRAGTDGNVCVPEGWNITGVLDPSLHSVMKQFIQDRRDADQFNKGKMVIITNTQAANSTPEWIVVEKKNGQFHVPPGFQFAELEESALGTTCQKFGEHGSDAFYDLQVKVRNGNAKFAKRIGTEVEEYKFTKVPADSAGDMATVAEARANHEKVLSLLDEWTIALLDGGKVDGKGHGGKVQDGDFKDQCGEKIIVLSGRVKQRPQELKFKKVPIGHSGRMPTVAEVRANQKTVMSLLDEWTIALVDGGKVDGPGHGWNIHEGNFQDKFGEKIIVEGGSFGIMETPMQTSTTHQAQTVPGYDLTNLKFKKVPIDHDGWNRMATVAEAQANHEKVLSLLDEWTIALLDGGKVDGKGHGGKVQQGNFKDQCGEKIIVI